MEDEGREVRRNEDEARKGESNRHGSCSRRALRRSLFRQAREQRGLRSHWIKRKKKKMRGGTFPTVAGAGATHRCVAAGVVFRRRVQPRTRSSRGSGGPLRAVASHRGRRAPVWAGAVGVNGQHVVVEIPRTRLQRAEQPVLVSAGELARRGGVVEEVRVGAGRRCGAVRRRRRVHLLHGDPTRAAVGDGAALLLRVRAARVVGIG